MSLDISSMPATKRRASDDSWNKNRLDGARARVEELKATINAHLHSTFIIVFEADVTALHCTAEAMHLDATKHREYDARAKIPRRLHAHQYRTRQPAQSRPQALQRRPRHPKVGKASPRPNSPPERKD